METAPYQQTGAQGAVGMFEDDRLENISQVGWKSLLSCTSYCFLLIELAEGCILNYTCQNCIVLKVESPLLY